MRNDFNQKDKLIWSENYECWECGQNHWDCLHHIMGRGGPAGFCESSIYNSAPLNNENCHLPIHGRLMKDFSRMKLLVKTKKYLDFVGYKPTTKDYQFLDKYRKYYGS